jgi:dipeptidyl aminopeptidase/acylaminoacyl peptidase
VLLLVFAATLAAGCQIRRSLAPESTRQVQIAEIRRIMDRPALSPAVWSSDSRALAYAGDRRVAVYTLDVGEQDVVPVDRVTAVSWSSLNLLALIDRGTVWTLRPNGTDRRAIPLPGPAVSLAWAPGGDRLAVVLRHLVDEQTRFEVWLVSQDGPNRMILRAPASRAIRELEWFPDGLDVLLGLSTSPGSVITEAWRMRMSAAGHRQIPLPGPAVEMRLAPSGRYLAVIGGDRSPDRVGRVVITLLDGTSRRVVTPHAGRYSGLAWSPQGDKVVFADVADRVRAELWMADGDGSGRLHVYSYQLEYTDPAIELVMAWAPDARHLAFGTNTGTFRGPIWLATLKRR